VLTHGGHGTLARALVCGCPVVICPAGGDMAENAARVDRLGLGVRLPRRYGTPRGVRLAVERALSRPQLRERAERVARWATKHDGAAAAAEEIEAWAEAVTRRAKKAKAAGGGFDQELRGWDSNPQPSP
jgi:UDP:flavonoid glycosyltransferase YjiC (YdhE family)